MRPASATLQPWLRDGTTVERKDVEAVEFVKVRLPLVWRTLVRFRYTDGSVGRRMFIPARTERVHAAFRACEWPTRDLDWRKDAITRARGRFGK